MALADTRPNVLANWLSLYTERPTFTAETVLNLVQLDVVELAGRPSLCAVKVSMEFAVKYVLP